MARLDILVVFIGIALTCINAEEELYSDKFDNVDLLAIYNNDKLREQYFKCVMDLGPCVTEDAKYFKEIFSEMILTNCKKCTEKQKINLKQTIEWYTKNQPDEWKLVLQKARENMKKKTAS